MHDKRIIYDQPLNEIIRVCLRLEQLFQQIEHQLSDLSMAGTRNIINFITHVLTILDRPDLKTKLAKELSFHLANLSRFGNLPNIDSEKLNHLIQKIEEHSRNLIDSNGKMGQRVRDIQLLNALRLHLASPGGGCSFDLPLYHYWLQQTNEERQTTIQDWLTDFNQIKAVINLVLEIVRNNARTEEKVANNGFYQELLDPQSNYRMIRIGIPLSLAAYPEMSIGRHFLSVRFYSPDIEKRPVQFGENLPFCISYCTS